MTRSPLVGDGYLVISSDRLWARVHVDLVRHASARCRNVAV